MTLKSQVKKRLARRLDVPEIEFALERLAANNFRPQLIFDVGAYRGDFAQSCLRIFPQSQIACFEALEDKVRALQSLAASEDRVRVFPGLVGAENRERVALNESETASSVLSEHVQQNFQTKFHPMRTVDSIVADHFDNRSPDFLKLDVQGYEMEVLKGAERSLPQMQVVLAEVNLLDIHKGVPLLAEVVAWLNERGWVAYDICGLTRRPLDNALWQADMVFVPKESRLRCDKRWAA